MPRLPLAALWKVCNAASGKRRTTTMNIPGQLNPSPRLLLGPGPSDAHPRVLRAMVTPLLGHLDPQFLEIMNETQAMLRAVFRTANRLTFPVSATGMAGMEACVVNLIEPGDKMVFCSAGFFGGRIAEIGGRAGAAVTLLERPWGHVFDLNAIREALQKVRPKVLGIVHAETSTGAWQPLNGLGKLCHEFDTLLLADTVTSLGCVPVLLDDWGIDAAYSCSQKGLGCPPGLAPVSFSDRALDAVKRRKTKAQSWYLDVTLLQKYWGEERVYHHTAPISMVYALREGLRLILEEGLEARWARHLKNHQALKAGLLAMGLAYTAVEGHQLPQLNAVRIPAGVDDAAVRQRLLSEFGIEIGSGLGEFKGKAWRIGLMGYNSRANNVLLFLAALEQCLLGQGLKTNPGTGVAAANKVLAAA
jgi:alanine-glyoxylate transaminase/serine-glyoxylate transaminase/serine-pyruvate transaminase